MRQNTKPAFLIYDMPPERKSDARSIQRKLNMMGARMVQQSVWKTEKIKELMGLGVEIRKLGGRAEILEERLLF